MTPKTSIFFGFWSGLGCFFVKIRYKTHQNMDGAILYMFDY